MIVEYNTDLGKKLGVIEALIYAYLQRLCKNGVLFDGKKYINASVRMIARDLGIAAETSWRNLNNLIEQGYVERRTFGEKEARWYAITEKKI